jgi:hypothetical protein
MVVTTRSTTHIQLFSPSWFYLCARNIVPDFTLLRSDAVKLASTVTDFQVATCSYEIVSICRIHIL